MVEYTAIRIFMGPFLRTTAHLISTPIGTPHTVFDAALNSASTFFLKTEAGTDVALAGFFSLLPRFVSQSLRVSQVILRRRRPPIILVIKTIRARIRVHI